MALEDKILQVLERGAITYDGLRAAIGAAPSELDPAIRRLEQSRQISRDRGRFHNGATIVTQPTAVVEASAKGEPVSTTKKKPCNDCGVPKLLDDFPVNSACKDGHSGQCKKCIAEKSKAIRLAKLGRSEPAAAVAEQPQTREAPAPAPAPKVMAYKTSVIPPVMILHLHHGVRIGPVHTSEAGVAQMPYHVDVSAKQLDELTAWWLESKKSAA